MLTNQRAQRLSAKWSDAGDSALYKFGEDGIWMWQNHLLYLDEVQERIKAGEVALRPFTRPRKEQIELDQLLHYFEQKGLKEKGFETIWHKDFYGFPIPFLTKEVEGINKIKKLV